MQLGPQTQMWRKSSYSGDETNKAQCVEAADLGGSIGLRDSQAPDAGHLTVSRTDMANLVNRIKAGQLQL
ncbi:hypothetical protein GCM10022254_05230 [Actinomadura meridiana]|uniref:DUF397 domain-containing protein n=1 Tax=Actinomadura meridiana TaxID=559626 RepID=A0ABP8BSV6_9ACTN